MKQFTALRSTILNCIIGSVILAFSSPAIAAPAAGWQWINPRIPPVDLYGVWAGAADDVFAVGKGGAIVHWDGAAWTVMESGGEFWLRAIWGAATDDIYAVGTESQWDRSGVILHWNGIAWRTMVELDSYSSLYGLWGTSSSDIFAVGYQTIMHWDGNTWTAMAVPTDDYYDYYSVWGFAPDDVFVAGSAYYDGGFILHWDGATWTPMSVIPCESYGPIWGASSDDIFAVGNEDQNAYRIIVHWDGSNWSLMRKSSFWLNDIYGTASDNVFVTGRRDYDLGIMFHWDGVDWSVENTGSLNIELHGLYCTNDGETLAVGKQGHVLRRQGSQWDSLSSLTSENLNGLWGSAGDDVFAVGAAGVILHWNGAACSMMASGTTLDLFDVSGVAADDVFAVGSDYSGCSIILHWNGAAWSEMPLPEPCTLNSIWCAGSDDVFAVGTKLDVTSLVLHWDGAAWTEMYHGIDAAQLLSIWGSASNDVFAVGNYVESYDPLILHWDGNSWQTMQVDDPHYDIFYSVYGFSSHDVYAVGFDFSVFHWDGQAWSQVFRGYVGDRPPGAHPPFTSIWGPAPDDVYAVNGGALAHWDGNAWAWVQTSTVGYDAFLSSTRIWGAGSHDIFMVGDYGAMAHWDGSYPLGVRIGMPVELLPGMDVAVMGYLDNPGEPMVDVPVFFVLSMYSGCWFWPHWRNYYDPSAGNGIDYAVMNVPTGVTSIVVVPSFQMPDGGEPGYVEYYLEGAMLNSRMDEVLGEMAMIYGTY